MLTAHSMHFLVPATLTAMALAGPTQTGSTTRVSVTSAGEQVGGSSGGPSISADGRYVAFHSQHSALASPSGPFVQVYVHDRATGTTECASAGIGGTFANEGCQVFPALSADGRVVAFASRASNLVAGDTNGKWDVFARDRLAGSTTRVSVDSSGNQASDHSGLNAFVAISSDGRCVAFASLADDLVAGDSVHPPYFDLFVHDRLTGQTTLENVAASGQQLGGINSGISLSGDGRFVTFVSVEANVVPNHPPLIGLAVFVRDRVLGQTTCASRDIAGLVGRGWGPSISRNGRYIAFESDAANLVFGDTNSRKDVFVHDHMSNATIRASVDSAGVQGNFDSSTDHGQPLVTDDGRYVVFNSAASNLVPGDTNGYIDVFLHDFVAGETRRLSVSSLGDQALWGVSANQSISADGRYVAFQSGANNLVPGDTNYSTGSGDVFVRDRFGCSPTVIYCTAGTTSNGCNAVLSWSGEPSVAATSGFTITASSVEGQKSGLVFYGVTGRNAALWQPGGTSYLCVKPPTQRTLAANSGGTSNACDGSLSLDFLGFIASHPSSLGAPFQAGRTINAQCWFRDPPAPGTTNLSNGLEFVLCL